MGISTRMKMAGLGLAGVLAIGGGVVLAEGPGGLGGHGGHQPLRRTLQDIVQVSGLDQQVFIDGFKAGENIDQVLDDNNVDSASVQTQVLADIQAKLGQAVTDGKMDQPTADSLYAKAQERLPQLMERVPDPAKHPLVRLELMRGLVVNAADDIGIAPKDLVSAVKGGSTIADVASQHGVDPAMVISDLETVAGARIDQAESNGRVDDQQAQAMKEKLADRITQFVNEGGPRHQGS